MATKEEEEITDPVFQEDVVENYGNLSMNSPAAPSLETASSTLSQTTAVGFHIPSSSSSSALVSVKPPASLKLNELFNFFVNNNGHKGESDEETVVEAAENYTTQNSTQKMDAVLSQRLRNNKNSKTFLEKLKAETQNSPKKPQPSAKPVSTNSISSTVLMWNGEEFLIERQGKLNKLVFLIKQAEKVDDRTRKTLQDDNIILWTGATFILQSFDNENDEIYGLQIHENRIEIITTSCIYTGNLSVIKELNNLSTNVATKDPTAQTLVNFLSSCRIDEKESSLDSKTTTSGEKATSSGDTTKKTAAIKKVSQEHIPGKAKPIKVSEIQTEAIQTLEKRIVDQKKSLPTPEIRNLRIDVLQKDERIRKISRANVEVLSKQMFDGQWQHHLNYFIILQSGNQYFVLDGNHRLIAFKEFNAKAQKDRQYTTVKCHIYKNLDLNQLLLLTSSSYPQLPHSNLTFLQVASLTLKVIEENHLIIPSNGKGEAAFTKLMQIYFHSNYSPVITQFLRLPQHIFTSVLDIRCNDILIDQLDLNITFWKNFIKAVKKNESESIEALASLGTKTREEVEKLLKRMEINVLTLISEKCDHSYTDEKKLITFLSSNREITRKSFIESLKAIKFFKNRKRRSTSKIYLEGLKESLDKHFKKNSVFKNAVFLTTLDDDTLSEQNVIITQNLNPAFLTKLEEHYDTSIIVLLSNYGEEAPSLPKNLNPGNDEQAELQECIRAAVISVLIDDEVEIDYVPDVLPVTTIKASIYLPNIPLQHISNPTKYLLTLAKKNQCSVAETMSLQKLYNLAKLASSNDNVLLSHTSVKITNQLLADLQGFKKITVTGDEELNDLVTKCIDEKEPQAESGEAAVSFDNQDGDPAGNQEGDDFGQQDAISRASEKDDGENTFYIKT